MYHLLLPQQCAWSKTDPKPQALGYRYSFQSTVRHHSGCCYAVLGNRVALAECEQMNLTTH